MSFPLKHRQQGATLLIGMVMLVVLTLLVVFAIRSGNTNLRIASNMQTQAEAKAASQQVIEQVIAQIVVPTTDISTITAQTVTVPIDGATYTVSVSAMNNKCLFTTPVLNSSLDSSNANDVPCFANPDEDKAVLSSGALSTKPSACNTQQWEIEAKATEPTSGAEITQVQGITIRVPSTTTCL